MSPVEWTRRSGEDVAHVIAMLLCSENPSAMQIRPSQGDGGIDVRIPQLDGSVEIVQVKKFATNLTAGQKRQIKNSFAKIRARAADEDWSVSGWRLMLPLDPTPQNLTWFETVTDGAPFECSWWGLTHVDALAAKYPYVIDYYLHSGKERLSEAVAAMMRVFNGTDNGALVTPAQVADQIEALNNVLDTDPHFIYAVHLDPVRPTLDKAEERLVAAVQRSESKEDSPTITIKVYARFDEAVNEREVPFNLTVKAEPGSELEKHLHEFRKYGKGFAAPMGSVNGEIGLPGGLGGKIVNGALRLGDPATGERYSLRAGLVDEEGNSLTTVVLDMEPVTVGVDGAGVRAHGTEQHGAFAIEILIDLPERRMRLKMSSRDVTGRIPVEVLPGLRFSRDFHHPNRLTFAQLLGPVVAPPVDLPPFDESATGREDREIDAVVEVVEAIATIQDFTTTQLRIPDLTTVTLTQAGELTLAASLLRGETFPIPAEEVAICLSENIDEPDEDFSFMVQSELSATVGPHQLNLGTRVVHCPQAAAVPGSLVPHDDHKDIRVRPLAPVTLSATPRIM